MWKWVERLSQILAGSEPKRDTFIYPRLTPYGAPARKGQAIWKPTPLNLRYFSRSPYCRRAIMAIQYPVAALEWEIVPRGGVPALPGQKRRIKALTHSLHNPNGMDSWHSMIEAVIEDIFLGAGAIEQQLSSDPDRPLWLWPVDGLSIQIYAQWSGRESESRYLQIPGMSGGTGYSMGGVHLRNDELIYIKPNPNTSTPFGLGAVEIAFMTISRIMGAETYAGNVASNASPNFLMYLPQLDNEQLQALRDYWQNEVEGRGIVPIFSGGPEGKPEILPMHERKDEALYLKWQEYLIREIAACFNLHPMLLGATSDVNRATAEVVDDQAWDLARKPLAVSIARHLNRHTIWGLLGWTDLEFRFKGIERSDELEMSTIYKNQYQNNLITPNEQRTKMGLPKLDSPWADRTWADVQIAIGAAKGSKEVMDPILKGETDDDRGA